MLEIVIVLMAISMLVTIGACRLMNKRLGEVDGYVLVLEDRVHDLETFLNLPHDMRS